MKLRRRKNNPTGDMPLVEHLKELRRRVVISLIVMGMGTVVGFLWYEVSPVGLMPLGEIIRRPYCSLPAENRADFNLAGECRLLATTPLEMFMLRLKVGFLAGLVLSSPFWLYQVWAFITPGLLKNERRWAVTFVTLAVTLFVSGSVLAYFIVDVGLLWLGTAAAETSVAAWTGASYFNFLLALVVIFGISFEVPLIIVMLNIVGLLEYNQIKEKRRFIWVGIFIFAALLSPGGDPFSMVALGLCVGLLVEIAFMFCRWNDKRRGYDSQTWEELDDDEATDLDYRPEPITPARPTTRRDYDDVL